MLLAPWIIFAVVGVSCQGYFVKPILDDYYRNRGLHEDMTPVLDKVIDNYEHQEDITPVLDKVIDNHGLQEDTTIDLDKFVENHGLQDDTLVLDNVIDKSFNVHGAKMDTVAFTATVNVDHVIQHDSIVVLNHVISNHGGGYDSNTGIFTAPTSGVYVFQIHALTTKGNAFWLNLFHNNDYVISVFARHYYEYAAAGNSAVLTLKKGDQVYMTAWTTAHLFGRHNERYATLTGFLIGQLPDGGH
ncbi:hypothetical protein BsWGS_04009 [Bradybaena similaris]